MSRFNILVQNSAWLYSQKIAVQVIQLAVTVYVIRKLSVQDFGILSIILVTAQVVSQIIGAGIRQPFLRYLPTLTGKGEHHHLKRFLATGFICSSAMVLAICLALHVLVVPFSAFFKIPVTGGMEWVFLVIVGSSLLQNTTTAALSALLLQRELAIASVAVAVLRAAAYVLLAADLTWQVALAIETGAIGLLVLLSLLILGYQVMRRFSEGSSSPLPYSWRSLASFSFYSTANELGVATIGGNSDYYIVSAMSASAANLGIFSFANRVTGILNNAMPTRDFLDVLKPVFYQKFADKRADEEYSNTCNLLIKVLLLFNLFPLIYFSAFGQDVIDVVFGHKYAHANVLVCILLCHNMVSAVFFPMTLTIILHEKMEILFYSKMIGVASIAFGILAMQFFGLMGVVLVTLMGNVMKNLFMQRLLRPTVRMEYYYRQFFPFLANSSILIILFAQADHLVTGPVSLAVATVCFVCVYAAIFFLHHPFSAWDIGTLQRSLISIRGGQQVSSLLASLYPFGRNSVIARKDKT